MTIRTWLAQHPEVIRERVEIETNYGDSLWRLTESALDEIVVFTFIYEDGSATIVI